MSKRTKSGSADGERIAFRLGLTLRALDRAFVAASHRVRKRSDTEAVHDMRVAIRKIRVMLKLGRRVYGTFVADSVRNEFTVLHRSTGALRDEEVLADTLASLACDADDFAAWKETRKARRSRLHSQVEKLASERGTATPRALLLALLVLPTKPSRNVSVDAFAKRALAIARRRVRERAAAAPDDGNALHALRIAEKGLRYSIEPFVDVLREGAAAEAEHAAKCQKRLGEIHDLDVARLAIQRARRLSPSTRETLLGELAERRARCVTKWLSLGPVFTATTENNIILSDSGSSDTEPTKAPDAAP